MHILMVSPALHITSQVKHRKKHNSIDSERKSVKRNANYQNHLTVCFYMLFYYAKQKHLGCKKR